MALLTKQLHPACRGLSLRKRFPLLRLAGTFGVLAAGVLWVGALEPQPSEYQIKAAFLVAFPKYVDWPPEVFAESNSPIVIVILGEHKFGTDLEKMVQGKTVNARRLTIRYVATEQDVTGTCHILFVAASERSRLPAILEKLRGTPALTVGEVDDFLDQGGMIGLARRDQKIRLEVNLAPARQAGLRISSRLLSVAEVVKGREN